jgi:hypothetical protein
MADATVRLSRSWSFGLGGPGEPWSIEIDGNRVGSIADRETVELVVEPGHHTLRLGQSRHRSREQSFDVAEGESVGFLCHSPRIWPVFLAALVKPDLWIALRRD